MTDYYVEGPAKGLCNCQPELLKNEESVSPDSARRNLQKGSLRNSSNPLAVGANSQTLGPVELFAKGSFPEAAFPLKGGLPIAAWEWDLLRNLTCRPVLSLVWLAVSASS